MLDDKEKPPSPSADIPLHDIESGSHRGDSSRRNSTSGLKPYLQEKVPYFEQAPTDWFDRLDAWFIRLGITLTPSFLQHWVGGHPPQESKLHAIAALDGLRGWACLLVFNFHFLFTYTWKVAVGWGFNRENFSVLQLPIVHLLVSGHIMVAIFFVMSGYVLSYKPLKTIRNQSWEEAFAVLASSTFRRGMRLYIPSIIGILLVLLAVRAGAYHYSHQVISEGYTIQGTNEQHPPLIIDLQDQLRDWWGTVMELVNPWYWHLYYNFYNPHLWTIPVEFRCSIVLFITILATSRLMVTVRMSLVACLIWFCVNWGRWDVVLFLCGMLMAEIDLINGTWEHPQMQENLPAYHRNSISRLKRSLGAYSQNWWLAIFIIGLYFGSSPNLGFKWTPFYMWLAKFTPKTYPEPHRFPQTIGAVLIVFSVNHSREIQKLFVNPVSQYLGRISYAFYIVHGPILHSLGYSIMPSIWNVVGKDTNFRYCLGFVIGWLICLPVSIWAADLFWRNVDVPTVKFARWLEGKLTVKGAKNNRNNSDYSNNNGGRRFD
ncbi:hypothetical protein MPDQ_006997 [Monascus purpureus]|uniref:Acyltransferase 3 domain-containing protein n=1 Tax=Monascus purpureus TaxID=5098 RepID=A0A507QTD6_MONPU|nr:hypothetical protein MPDQ_006997 [Monascus purpureus]BDD63991.1 hypothetical protein MAP00_008841 [Monascus purpureus]